MTVTAFRWLATALSIALLSACSSQPKTPQANLPMSANQSLQHWQLSGKIGLRNGKQGHSAYLNWRQCGEHYTIRLTGPLGQGAAQLTGNNALATLQTSDQQRFQAANAEQLLAEHFGWQLPVSQLQHWIRGIPDPRHRYQAETAGSGFQQLQWQLTYPKLLVVANHQLPAKAIAEQAPLKVTLVIKDWQLLTNCDPE
jgi:outer membrane lipoprotein LolB